MSLPVHQPIGTTLTVDDIMRLAGFGPGRRPEAIAHFRKLHREGYGSFCLGRRHKPSRFTWGAVPEAREVKPVRELRPVAKAPQQQAISSMVIILPTVKCKLEIEGSMSSADRDTLVDNIRRAGIRSAATG